MTTSTITSMTNGRLAAMEPRQRIETVLRLTDRMRLDLAHLCVLGAARELEKAQEHVRDGFPTWAEHQQQRHDEHLNLAALLTRSKTELIELLAAHKEAHHA